MGALLTDTGLDLTWACQRGLEVPHVLAMILRISCRDGLGKSVGHFCGPSLQMAVHSVYIALPATYILDYFFWTQ